MATTVEQLPPRRGATGGGKYPWDEWLDGQVWLISADELNTKPASFTGMAYQAASARNVKVSVRNTPEGVYLQAKRNGPVTQVQEAEPTT